MRRFLTVFLAALVALAVSTPPAEAGDDVKGILDILTGRNKNSGQLIKSLEKVVTTNIKEKNKRAVALDTNASKLEAERLKLQGNLEKTRSKYRADLLKSKIKGIEAALESVEKRRVELGLSDEGPTIVTIDSAPLSSVAMPTVGIAGQPVSVVPTASAAPTLSARDLRALRAAHVSKDTYTEAEATLRGFVVLSNGELRELTAVDIGGELRYWVRGEHLQ